MTENIDLKNLERKAFSSIIQDGFFDIYLGILLFGIGIISSFSDALVRLIAICITMVIGLLVFYYGKKHITVPRMGIIKFRRKRMAEKKKFVFILQCREKGGVVESGWLLGRCK